MSTNDSMYYQRFVDATDAMIRHEDYSKIIDLEIDRLAEDRKRRLRADGHRRARVSMLDTEEQAFKNILEWYTTPWCGPKLSMPQHLASPAAIAEALMSHVWWKVWVTIKSLEAGNSYGKIFALKNPAGRSAP